MAFFWAKKQLFTLISIAWWVFKEFATDTAMENVRTFLAQWRPAVIAWDFLYAHPALIVVIVFIGVISWGFLGQRRGKVTSEPNSIQLKTHELFDVECRTTTIGLPLNLQKDGTWRTSSARLSPSPIYIIHRGDLITITRVTLAPEVHFTYMDGTGWETTNAITVTPQRPLPASMGSHGAIDFEWDTTNPLQWVLTGLPLIMGKDEHLQLPAMNIGVLDANLVGTHFAKLDWCKLAIRLTIRTDKGSPYVPDLSIELTSSDIKNVNPKFYWKDVTNEPKD